MRTAFIETLVTLAQADPRIWLLSGDLGYSVLERFSQRFPDRYLNVGVAEQNMIGVAAGLALSGKIVFVYSIANFPTLRPLEQIRNDVCYHNANVKIVAVGGGLAYGTAGYTHHGLEDIGALRALPNLTILAPGDPVETRLTTHAAAAQDGPCYLRLGKGGEPIVHSTLPDFEIDRPLWVRPGTRVVLLTTGPILPEAVKAADRLNAAGDSVGVLSVPTLKPFGGEAIRGIARTADLLITVEEHSIIGGLGSAVAEVLAEMDKPHARLIRCGAALNAAIGVGSQNWLRRQNRIDDESIAALIEHTQANHVSHEGAL